MTMPVKVILVVAGALFLILNAGWLLPVALVLAPIYAIYFGIFSLSSGQQTAPRVPTGSRCPAGRGEAHRPRRAPSRVRWQEACPTAASPTDFQRTMW